MLYFFQNTVLQFICFTSNRFWNPLTRKNTPTEDLTPEDQWHPLAMQALPASQATTANWRDTEM